MTAFLGGIRVVEKFRVFRHIREFRVFNLASFPKESVENVDFYKPILNKIMTTHE